jgi:hypothetical protein
LTLEIRLPYVEALPGEDLIPDADEYGVSILYPPFGTGTPTRVGPEFVTDIPGAVVDRAAGTITMAPGTPIAGKIVNMQLWAVVTNGGPGVTGLEKVYASVLSNMAVDPMNPAGTPPGAILGDMTDAWGLKKADFVPGFPAYGWNWNPDDTWATNLGSNLGEVADLDGDGDMDLGYVNDDDPNRDKSTPEPETALFARPTGSGPIDGTEFLLADIQMVLAGYAPGGEAGGETTVWARGRNAPFNKWFENGIEMNAPADLNGGSTGVTLVVVPEPATLALLGLGLLPLFRRKK